MNESGKLGLEMLYVVAINNRRERVFENRQILYKKEISAKISGELL